MSHFESVGGATGSAPAAVVTVEALAGDPHPLLARLRAAEPVSWLPALGSWLVTGADLAEHVMRDSSAFTVDDPRFSTARVVGPSMLSLDGPEHRRHRDPFARTLRAHATLDRLSAVAADAAGRLVEALAAAGEPGAELRRGLAGPLAVAVMSDLLGLDVPPGRLLSWYDAIVAGVTALSGNRQAPVPPGAVPTSAVPASAVPASAVPAGATAAFTELAACVESALAAGLTPVLGAAAGQLTTEEIVSNAAVLLFGGIETTEGMICNAVWHLLSRADLAAQVAADRDLIGPAIEESLRLEPAAAMVDRYATADVALGSAAVRRGDLVVVSLAAANRDPAVWADPDRFDLHRPHVRQHVTFAVGPHFCIGAQLARLETAAALAALFDQLPRLRLDPARPSAPAGLVFRKPPALHVRWDR